MLFLVGGVLFLFVCLLFVVVVVVFRFVLFFMPALQGLSNEFSETLQLILLPSDILQLRKASCSEKVILANSWDKAS